MQRVPTAVAIMAGRISPVAAEMVPRRIARTRPDMTVTGDR
jgi:hypothetical protein